MPWLRGGLAWLAVTVCALGTASAGPAAGGPLVLYTSIPEEIANEFGRTFTTRYPQIRLDILRAGAAEIERRMFAEIEVGGLRADLLWLSDAPVFLTLRDRGHLQRYLSPEARTIPLAWRDPRGFFVAGRLVNVIIATNTTLIPATAAPRRWGDVPRFGRTTAMPNPFFSGSVLTVVATLVREYGWGWFERARREGIQILRSNSDVGRALGAREVGVGITFDFITYGLIQDGAPLSIIWPEEGAMSIPSPVAITAGARNVEGARLFVDYVLSREGQQALVAQGIIPVRPDVAPPKGLPRPGDIKTMPIPYEWTAQNAAELRRKFEEIMLR